MSQRFCLGIVGLGMAGTALLKQVADMDGEVAVAAVCDCQVRLDSLGERWRDVPAFSDWRELIASGLCDGVYLATPHRFHAEQAIAALDAGLHVLCEKPMAVDAADAELMNAAAERNGRLLAVNHNRRAAAPYAALKAAWASGELGELQRVSWICTDWFRSNAYFTSSPWRGTWAGEGGGLMLNQCIHDLDLWVWTVGMPDRLCAACSFGQWHDVEVEDEVSIIAQYPNGATGTFVASNGEAPGVRRIEVVGTRGTVCLDDSGVRITRLEQSSSEVIANGTAFDTPKEIETSTIKHVAEPFVWSVLHNFLGAVRGKVALEVPGYEAIGALQLANAALLSGWTDAWVEVPCSQRLFSEGLQEKMANSTTRDVAVRLLDLHASLA